MKAHTILKQAVITEKSLEEAKNNRYTFVVNRRATKTQIKQAVQTVFGVEVKKVATTKALAGVRRTGRRRLPSQSTPIKKAIVQIKLGQAIKLFETTG